MKKNTDGTEQDLAQSAVKALFEQTHTGIKDLGIAEDLLKSTMKSLVISYCEEKEFKLAVDAATISDEDKDFRTILDAMQSQMQIPKSDRWIDAMIAHYHNEGLLMTILLRVGSEEELRELAKQDNVLRDRSIRILRHLKDSEALVKFGRQRLDDYFRTREEEKAKGCSCSSTSSIPEDALEYLKAALNMEHPTAPAELIEFGDRLRKKNGIGQTYYTSGGFSDKNDDPAIQAYELSNCPEGSLKAAQCHQEIAERHLQEENRKKDGLRELARAAKMFAKAEEFAPLSDIANKFVEHGELLQAVKALHLANEQITAAILEQLMGSTSKTTTETVKATILKHLDTHNRDIPFRTHYTYWHFSQSNEEWGECLLDIEQLASRFDRRGWNGREADALSKQLYSTSKANAIGALHNRLQHHLIVGWMLSGVSRDIKHGAPTQNRKYSFSTYAAFRTFIYAVDASGYNPFDGDIGLAKDEEILAVSEFLNGIIDEWGELLHEGSDTRESDQFINSKLGEMENRLKQVFDTITNDIRKQVESL